jgi:hypothetical protein
VKQGKLSENTAGERETERETEDDRWKDKGGPLSLDWQKSPVNSVQKVSREE